MKKQTLLNTLLLFIILLNIVLVKTGIILPFDNWIHSKIVHIDWLTNILLFLTNFGSVKYIVILCVLLLLFYKPKTKLWHLYGVTILSTLINNIIKVIVRRPRPELMSIVIEKTFSFPSGHAMATMTFYGFLIYMIYSSQKSKRFKRTLIGLLSCLIFIVGFSRIYLYVHYFSDVFTGFLCSIFLLSIYIKIMKKQKLLETKL